MSASIPWSDVSPLPSPPAPPPAQGSMGVVFAATHRGHRVAVKVFKMAALAAGELERAVSQLRAEVDKMARASEGGLNDGVVVPVGVVAGAAVAPWVAALGHHASACVSAAQLCGIAMKWQDGGTLAELLHAPTRAWGAGTAGRLQLCAQLASGVAALHAAGVVHGDVKGENVLLSDRGATPRPRFTDFGFAELRTVASSSRVSSAMGEKRGTWPYMAPEMLLDKEDGSPPEGVSRSGDVYALGTLCWEVLTGRVPWTGFNEQRRLQAALRGTAATATLLLTTPPLPVDTPPAVKELLGACLSTEKAARPRAARAAEALHQAAQDMASGAFDIFLSHAWVDGAHAPLTTEVYLRLLDAGYRVWLDTAEMRHDMELSMESGIAKSGCVVALLSAHYGTKPDPAKDNCLKELRWAKSKGKPIVACLADVPGPDGRAFFPTGEVAALVNTSRLMPDLRAAAAVDWRADVSAEEREVLTKAPDALPKVLKLVAEVLGRALPQQQQ
jgi:serine/threonine protein kinase